MSSQHDGGCDSQQTTMAFADQRHVCLHHHQHEQWPQLLKNGTGTVQVRISTLED